MAFQRARKVAQQNFTSPEEMYKSLPRKRGSVPGLWIHQGDVVRTYAAEHSDTPDLALELPTGSGKTLPGLLIGEWIRRTGKGPVLFATPTRQLARQVYSTADREGVPATLLVGSSKDWTTADKAAVQGADSIGITTYASVFNTSPKLPPPHLLIFDDAHAGEEFVAQRYCVSISRYRESGAYAAVLEALGPYIPPILANRLGDESEVGGERQVRLILPGVDPDGLQRLDHALRKLEGSLKYPVQMILAGLASCCVYVSYGSIQIRPMIPPTSENDLFAEAQQRIYLSATLGAGGEMERAFGRENVVRMPLPSESAPRSGRRFFVFPDLVKGNNGKAVAREIVRVTDKALVLSQATVDRAEQAAEELAGEDVEVLGLDDVEGDLGVFADADSGVLGLANRYDGLDLPGDACRIVVLDGKPDAASLQDRFLSERANARVAVAERLRTRIVQGAGRCTRGPDDYAVVVVLGDDITTYFSIPTNRSALEPELQAEVELGWDSSHGESPEEVLKNVGVFLEQDDEWRTEGEPLVIEGIRDAVKVELPGSEALSASAPIEVHAWRLAHQEDWRAASAKMHEAARELGKGGEATRGYRGLLLYIAAAWLHQGAANDTERGKARELVREAEKAAQVQHRGTWLKEMPKLAHADPSHSHAAVDVIAINQIATRLSGKLKANRVMSDLAQMRKDLDQTSAVPYEQGLTTLGTHLGAAASKPRGDGRCDSAWLWDNEMWMTVEAKSEQLPDGTVPLHDLRQANTQMQQLASDQGMAHPPPNSPIIIVSPRSTVDPKHVAAANEAVCLAHPDLISQIAADIEDAWCALLAGASADQGAQALRDHVYGTLSGHGCLPTQVIDRLTVDPVRELAD